ncbi:uncharacterized protein LOC109841681 [Asparagus officinalis]|uniref:uncharacterized protein LOC109841681 n=1 Tax=Asparagus officinalis TaxID=4686 RepID=UPI00098DFE99|nr:uncharacterized protein LOC109841681 [Asparagus officinalis]
MGEASKSSSFHPALAVTNIKSFIPITLEMEKVHYSSWAELFKIHATAYDVIQHILPPSEKDAAATPTIDKASWARLDAIVLQWIYGTISTDLLYTILEPGTTAKQAWDRLQDIFYDNKNSRAVDLETQFSTIKMQDFPNGSAYCQHIDAGRSNGECRSSGLE